MDQRKAFEQLIDKYISGARLSQEEQELLDAYFNAFEGYGNVLGNLPAGKTDLIGKELQRRITGKIQGQPEPVLSRRRAGRGTVWYLGLAACIVLAVGAAFFLVSKRTDKASIDDGTPFTSAATYSSGDSTRQVLLADGSLVFLNRESELRVSEDFGTGERVVYLMGEGYFDVSHDAERPFIVQCGDMDVRVMGTTFIAKSTGTEQAVGLLSGSVQLHLETEHITLNPGEYAAHTAGEGLSKEPRDIAALIAWKPQTFELADVTMAELADFIQKRYQLELTFENTQLKNCRITHQWTGDETWQELLEIVGLVNQFEYTARGNRITLTGNGCTVVQ